MGDEKRLDKAAVQVQIEGLVLGNLEDAIETIQRRGRAVKAPDTATVTLETAAYGLQDEVIVTTATIEWPLED